MIDAIVGSAILLYGIYLVAWASRPVLRERIENPKHVFLQQAREFDRQPEKPE